MKFLTKLQAVFISIICCQSCNSNQDAVVARIVESKPVASVIGSQPAAMSLILTLARVQPPKRDVNWRKLKKPKMDYRLFWINNSNKYMHANGTVNDSLLNANFDYTVRRTKAAIENVSNEEFAARLDIPGALFTESELKSALTGADSGYANYKRGQFHHYRGIVYGDR